MIALLALAAAAERPPICTDRPTKANAVCTVPAGLVQVEGSLADWAVIDGGGGRTSTVMVAPTTIKLGLTAASDLQLAWTPLGRVRTRGEPGISGAGDLVVRFKQRLTPGDDAVQIAIIPFAKVPTAKRDIGNGRLEGGVAVPLSFTAGRSLTVTLGPEADILADADGCGRHPAFVNLVNLSGPVAPRVTLAGELWSNLNFDPAGTIRQASADASVAYLVSKRLQLDAGANFGLTKATPAIEFYAGASFRF